MTINYYQPREASRDGVLVLDGQIFRTTGRLDAAGSRVFAWGFGHRSSDLGPVRLAVQCERTSESTLAVEITVFGRRGAILLTQRVSDVPLSLS